MGLKCGESNNYNKGSACSQSILNQTHSCGYSLSLSLTFTDSHNHESLSLSLTRSIAHIHADSLTHADSHIYCHFFSFKSITPFPRQALSFSFSLDLPSSLWTHCFSLFLSLMHTLSHTHSWRHTITLAHTCTHPLVHMLTHTRSCRHTNTLPKTINHRMCPQGLSIE